MDSTPILRTLPKPFNNTHPPPFLITQGAEGLIYRTHFLLPSRACALKYRPSKPYRHPTLDARLTRHRILSEARTLVRCRREGVSVPGVYAVEWDLEGSGGGWMMMEWVEGRTVKDVLVEGKGKVDMTWEEEVKVLMGNIGSAVGRLHEIGVVHGDLTTSNLMLRTVGRKNEVGAANEEEEVVESPAAMGSNEPEKEGEEIVLIDFGLAAQNSQDEDKAVDLYVLERAFGSTHPEAEEGFKEVLKAYRTSYRGAAAVLKRLEDVRMRGRKRSMVG